MNEGIEEITDYAIRNVMKRAGVPRIGKSSFNEIRNLSSMYMNALSHQIKLEIGDYAKINVRVAKRCLNNIDWSSIHEYSNNSSNSSIKSKSRTTRRRSKKKSDE